MRSPPHQREAKMDERVPLSKPADQTKLRHRPLVIKRRKMRSQLV